jgi:hypothetical protein
VADFRFLDLLLCHSEHGELSNRLASAGLSACRRQTGCRLAARHAGHPNDLTIDEIVISWDTATKATELSDYSVGTVWGVRGDFYYLLDLVRVRPGFPGTQA